MKRLLVIDGNYFAMRVLGQLNMGESKNDLETTQEKQNFLAGLNSSLIGLRNTFINNERTLIDNIIFVNDNHSWRKDITPYKPYYTSDTTLIGYKEQRIEVKENSSINYDNFYSLFRQFVETIKPVIPVFDNHGLEGDDNILLISDKVKTLEGYEILTFCTDGDIEQTVHDKSLIFRNIKSKVAPFGEFVISLNMYKNVFEENVKATFLKSTNDYKKLFSINIGSEKLSHTRTINQGISVATPYRIALVKSICGDKKDNIFSILSWKSSTGTLNYKITEKHIEKALKEHNVTLTESNCRQILQDKDMLINLLMSLKKVTKQDDIEIKKMAEHLKHNLRLIILAKSNIPKEYVEAFDNSWELQLDKILNGNTDGILRLNSKITDNASDVFANSIIVDEILNS